MQREREGAISATLLVRNDLPPPALERARSMETRLDDLESRGILEVVRRTSWEKRVPIADCDAGVRDTYLSFEAWATDAGARLTPFFQTRECYTRDGSDTTDWLVVPAVTLAVYEEGELAAVYPHASGEETRSVEDGLAVLEADPTPAGQPATLPAD